MQPAYFTQFDRVTKIIKGMSGDEKFLVERGGEKLLLRVSDSDLYDVRRREFEHLRHLHAAGLPVPACVSFEKDADTGEVLTLLSWVEGEEAEEVIPRIFPDEQYAHGMQAGQILREIHEHSVVESSSEDWHDRYFKVIEPRLEAFRREGARFDGCDSVLQFSEAHRALLRSRPLCVHHGDYHMGNLILHHGRLWVIDWQTVDFGNIGDPWYEFNRISTEHPHFAKGQIDGYFANHVPDEFWRLFALYLSASALTSIVWAMHWAPEEFDSIMALNRRVHSMFDGMKNPVPSWYRE